MDAEQSFDPWRDARESSERWRGFRGLMTRALRPISVVAPVALVVVSIGFVFKGEADGGWGNFIAIAGVAAVLFIALQVLVRLFEARRTVDPTHSLTRRDSLLLAALVLCAAWWLTGAAGLPALPDRYLAGLVIPNFINGMFGVCVTLGMLIVSARRSLKA